MVAPRGHAQRFDGGCGHSALRRTQIPPICAHVRMPAYSTPRFISLNSSVIPSMPECGPVSSVVDGSAVLYWRMEVQEDGVSVK